MDDHEPPLTKPSTSDAAERSLVEDVKNLIDDGRTLFEAELAFQKSRTALVGNAAKSLSGLVALFAALVFFALMALTLGSILVLAPLVGALGATGIVTGILLILAGLTAWAAQRRWRSTVSVLKQPENT